MAIRMDFEVRKLPDSYVTKCIEHAFEDDPSQKKDRYGNPRQRMVEKVVEKRGGWLIIVRGKPGHSIRLESLEQAEALKLIDHETYMRLKDVGDLRPRLIDAATGEEVNEQGIPLNIARELEEGTTMPKNASRSAMGHVETDVDVNHTGDEAIDVEDDPSLGAGAEHVSKAIGKLE